MTATDTPTTEPGQEPEVERWWTVGRVLATVLCVGFLGMWAYLFLAGNDHHPEGWLTDRTFPKAAEPICKAARKDLAELTPARDSKTASDRADVIGVSTERLRRMQSDLRAVVPATADAKYIDQWIDDWSIYFRDRIDYAASLRKDPAAEFLVTKKYGAQLSESLDNYADVNQMPSCETPGDV